MFNPGTKIGKVARSKGGCVIQRLRYVTQQVCVTDQGLKDFSEGSDVVHVRTFSPVFLNDRGDQEHIWRRAQKKEKRKDAIEARTVDFSFPRALRSDHQILVVEEIGNHFAKQGLVVHAAIHFSQSADGGVNPHCHLTISDRTLDEDGLSDTKFSGIKRTFEKDMGASLKELIVDEINKVSKKHTGADHIATTLSNRRRGLAPPQTRKKRRVHATKGRSAIQIDFDKTVRQLESLERSRRQGDYIFQMQPFPDIEPTVPIDQSNRTKRKALQEDSHLFVDEDVQEAQENEVEQTPHFKF